MNAIRRLGPIKEKKCLTSNFQTTVSNRITLSYRFRGPWYSTLESLGRGPRIYILSISPGNSGTSGLGWKDHTLRKSVPISQRWEGGSGWGRHVNPRPFHFNVWQIHYKKKKKEVRENFKGTILYFKGWIKICQQARTEKTLQCYKVIFKIYVVKIIKWWRNKWSKK